MLALGYVASRITESALIATGIVSVLAVLTLREDLGSAAVGLDTTGQALVAAHDATFLLGPAFCPGFDLLEQNRGYVAPDEGRQPAVVAP